MTTGTVDTPVLLWVLLTVLFVRLVAGVTVRFTPSRRNPACPATQQRVEAERRAERLLQEVLPAGEYEQLCLRGYIETRSGSVPDRVYRISRYPEGVTIYEGGRYVGSLCAVPIEELPSGDIVLMHKLMLSANEDEYLGVAHRLR